MDLKQSSRPLPEIDLPAARDNAPVAVKTRARWSLVIAFLHRIDCPKCRDFLQQLKAVQPDITSWDGEVVIVLKQVPDNSDTIPEAISSFQVLVDTEQKFASAANVIAPAVLVVDQWRDIREIWQAGEVHRFPDVTEIVASVRYLATQCPECEGEAL